MLNFGSPFLTAAVNGDEKQRDTMFETFFRVWRQAEGYVLRHHP